MMMMWPPHRFVALLWVCSFALFFASSAFALADKDNQGRYTTPTTNGPDKDVPGFLVNLGPTGARGVLTEKSFIVRYIFEGSPAAGRLKLGDEITGVYGKSFTAHHWGGSPHGYDGPVMDLGNAIEKAESSDGKLQLNIIRDKKNSDVTISLEKIGAFSSTFPLNCKKSAYLREKALHYLAVHYDDVKGGAHNRSAVALALLSSDDPKQQALGKSMCKKWSEDKPDVRTNKVDPGDGTWTWTLSYQIITLGEYYLMSKDGSVLPTMQAASDLLKKAQYSGKILVWGPKGNKKDAALDKIPYDKLDAAQQLYDGGFGHTQYIPGSSSNGTGWGPNGYGPMQYPTIFAVIAWQIAERCGIKVDADRVKRAMGFIHRGSNAAGAVGYGGEFTIAWGLKDPDKYKKSTNGDNYVGRSGAALIAHKLSPEFTDSFDNIKTYRSFLISACKSLPDGHADTNLAVMWGLLGSGASQDEKTMRTMFDYHKAYFNMARCFDGSYVTQPGRDYADGGYYSSSRYHATGTMVLTYGFENPKLLIQGIEVSIPGVNPKVLSGKLDSAYKALMAKEYALSSRAIKSVKSAKSTTPEDVAICDALTQYISSCLDKQIAILQAQEKLGDINGLKENYDRLVKDFAGVDNLQEKITHFEESFKQDTWKEEIKIGAQYARMIATFKRSQSKTSVRDLEKFAEKYPDSLYGKWAALVFKEYNTNGAIIDP